jgi:hypothetical protein
MGIDLRELHGLPRFGFPSRSEAGKPDPGSVAWKIESDGSEEWQAVFGRFCRGPRHRRV